MTEEEYRNAMGNVIYLAGCAVKEITPDRRRFEAMELGHLYEAARRHMLAAAVGMALEQAGITDLRFVRAVAAAQRKNALMDADRAAVLAALEEAGVWYMPLKGSILKDMYPRFGMREMVDNDILFDRERAADVRDIMEGLGFTAVLFVENDHNHDHYHKKPVSNFEMHRALIEPADGAVLYDYYRNVKDRLVPDKDKRYGYHFTDEDFYLYIIAHEYRHYKRAGTGLRSILDTYVLLRKSLLDMECVCAEAVRMGIADFEKKNRRLALHLFEGDALTPDEEKMLDYIISSGTYGTTDNAACNAVEEKGRWGYFLSRLNLPEDVMKNKYPVLRKAPILYPVFWVYRLLGGVFFRNRVVRIQLKAILGLSSKERSSSSASKSIKLENKKDQTEEHSQKDCKGE